LFLMCRIKFDLFVLNVCKHTYQFCLVHIYW